MALGILIFVDVDMIECHNLSDD